MVELREELDFEGEMKRKLKEVMMVMLEVEIGVMVVEVVL